MNSFWQIVRHIAPYKNRAIANIIFNILAVLFSLVSLAMILPFLRLLFDTQALNLEKPVFSWSINWAMDYFNYALSNTIVTQGKISALMFVCLVVVAVFFLKNLFRFAALHLMAHIRNGVVRDVRDKVFNKMLLLPVSYFSESRKGDIITRLTSDVQEVEYSIMSVLEVTFREPITIISYLLTMLFISPQLTLFVFILLPLTGIIIGGIGRTLRKASHQAQNKLGILMSVIDETLSGLRIIHGFNAQQTQAHKFKEENQAHFSIMTSLLRRRELSSPLTEFLSIGIVALVLYIGGRMVLNQSIELAPEMFILFMVVFSQIIPPAKAFSSAFYNIQKGMASVERINSILDAPIAIVDAKEPQPLTAFKESIVFKNVHFNYEAAGPSVLQDINVALHKGQTLALVGASGAGKSTLADLVPRFYDIQQGEVLLDGINIKHYSLHDLRALMGIVTQEPILFNDTIANNISFGIPPQQVTKAAIVQAAKVANAHNFISQLSEGYHTIIGDRGHKLSGGERQRLTIARAVLKNPPILILDEATSSLDAASEKLVQDALLKLMQNRTSIIIAHRLSTIQYADQILVMQNGRIIERGTHQSLMGKEDSAYKKLVALQAF